MKKRLILAVLCVFSCLIFLVGCGNKDSVKKNVPSYDKEMMTKAAKEAAEQWGKADFKSFAESERKMTDEERALFEAQALVQEEAGAFEKVIEDSLVLTTEESYIRAEQMLQCENGKIILKLDFDENYRLVHFSSEKYASLIEKMEKAGLNTLFGMFFIFSVLIFISFVIMLIGQIPKLTAKKIKSSETKEESTEPLTVQEVEEAPSDLSGEELTAVITAAIMAYTADNVEVPADGLIVRSIKRRNMAGWKKA